MKMILTFVSFLISYAWISAQEAPVIADRDYARKLKSLLQNEVPAISVPDLAGCREDFILLDTRSREEYDVSHLENARWVGYTEFDPSTLETLPANANIVCYCSVGYRSERIAAKLVELGHKRVYNLYGGIFEWVNRGFPVVNSGGQATRRIHGYNKKWSRWVLHPTMRVIY